MGPRQLDGSRSKLYTYTHAHTHKLVSTPRLTSSTVVSRDLFFKDTVELTSGYCRTTHDPLCSIPYIVYYCQLLKSYREYIHCILYTLYRTHNPNPNAFDLQYTSYNVSRVFVHCTIYNINAYGVHISTYQVKLYVVQFTWYAAIWPHE